jgi:hypothetical protein
MSTEICYKAYPMNRKAVWLPVVLMVGGMTYAGIHNYGPHLSSDTTSMASFTLRIYE